MDNWNKKVELSELNGKVISKIEGLEKWSDEVRIFTECGNEYLFYNDQDHASIRLEDFEISANSLNSALIISAQMVSNKGIDKKPSEYSESWIWTFYKIETNKGGLWMRWLGESNGYYSEHVSFDRVNNPESE